ncbi:1-acyl-sn-glycerol-3-phosphate acyltransferase [Teredinibacter haidensis]|uniref:1-acyl-sn-glycerol-3-phosphate acyltransferase n=1 Tax=Teredinibacter haidensis TaxID=2731755 RepID=UPI000948E1C0
MADFEDIRPYNDDEVRPILERLLVDKELLDTVAKLKLPTISRFAAPALRPLVRKRLAGEMAHIQTVADFQALVEKYMAKSLKTTVDHLSFSGLDKLNADESYLFISNHRDIAMDPAFVNWGLYHNGFSTLRIAIGDNLLSKPFASDIMRLNKSFIVRRGLSSRREKLQAAKKLSSYIHHSVVNDKENVWIAQREGRAKDGLDQTNPALINMLAISKPKTQTFAEFIREARIVPVSISYAYDACDMEKARELHQKSVHGSYTKDEHEDVQSIARGITGYKEAVHVSFGTPLTEEYENVDEVAVAIDQQIEEKYVLHPSNGFAYELLEKKTPTIAVSEAGIDFSSRGWDQERSKFKERIATCNEAVKKVLLTGYANPVYRRLGEK